MPRKAVPPKTQIRIFIKSRRRCCLCYWWNNDDTVKKGQIAHLDDNNENYAEDNLAYLCLDHHDVCGTTPSLTKKVREDEVKHWRNKLYERMAGGDRSEDAHRFIRYCDSVILTLKSICDAPGGHSLGLEEEVAGLARAAEVLGVLPPIEIPRLPLAGKVELSGDDAPSDPCSPGCCVIRYPGGAESRSVAYGASGAELLIEARASVIAALTQWSVHVKPPDS